MKRAALGVGLLAGVLATYPLVKRLGEAIPTLKPNCWGGDECADNLLYVWIVGEGGRRLYRHPLSLFDSNIFYPFRHTLAYSESMLSAGALVAPLNAITGNPILGYDLYYLATYVLSALGAYLLVREITGDARAGLLAGWLFALSPEHWRYHGALATISVQWVPFVLYTWIRFLEMPGTGRGFALAAALMAHLQAGTYHGIMLPVLLVPWALVLLVTRCWSIRRWLLSAAVLGPTLAAGLLLYLPYVVVRHEIEFDRPVVGWASSYQYWGPFVHPLAYLRDPRDSALFFVSPLPFVFLALAGIASAIRRHPIGPAPRREGRHLVAALMFTLVAAAVSLGVTASVAGLFAVPGPFFYLHRLPGFDLIRAPNRCTMLVACGGAVVGGIAIAVTLRRVRSQAMSLALALVFGSIIVLDARIREQMPLTDLPTPSEVPAVYRWLATTPEGVAVLEYPLAFFGGDSVYTFYSLYHGHPLFNGYSGLIPRFDDALNGFPDDVSLRTLQDAGISYVIVHTDRLRGTRGGDMALARLARRRDLARRSFGADLVVSLSPSQAQGAEPVGDALDPHAWTVWGSSPGAEQVADGSLDTHWTTSTVTDGSFLEIDLGAQHSVAGCTLRLGPHMLEYPREYRVLSSVDGVRWERIGGERPTVPPFASYRRDHLDVELPLRMQPTEARYLKIDVPADPPWAWLYSGHHWGAHEVSVYGK